MLMIAIKWLLPLIAIGFVAGVVFRRRAQIAVAIVLALGGLFYFWKYAMADSGGPTLLYAALLIPFCIAAYGCGAVFGKFVQSEVKGRPVMLTLSLLTVGWFLFATTNSAVYR